MIRNRHKHTRYILLAFFAVGIVAFFPLPTFAASLELYIHNFVFGVVGWIVAASASALDWSYTELVAKMGTNFIQQGIGSVINEMWTVIRDLFNILFIFGLIYIGFRTILFSDDTQTKRALGWLIVAALLINFSLFVSKAVVDVSNLTAIQVHSALTTSAGGSISSTFKRIIEINSMNYFKLDEEKLEDGNIAWTYYMGVLLLGIVITVTFFAGAFMLFARFIALVFLLVLSPVMFVGMIFPKFDEYAKMYWDRLLNYAFFAPFFLFALLLSAKTLLVLSNQIDGGNKLYERAFNPNMKDPTLSDLHVIAFLLISMGFMIGSIILAQRMGVAGASSTMSVFGKLKGGARNQLKRAGGAATFGLAGRIGRNTAGWGAQTLMDNGKFKRRMAESGWAGEKTMQMVSGLADSSFDARKVGGMGKALGIGEGRKGGYATTLKNNEERRAKLMEKLGTESSEYVAENTKTQREARDNAQNSLEKKKTELEEKLKPIRETIFELNEQYKNADPETKKEIAEQIQAQKTVLEETKTAAAEGLEIEEKKVKVAQEKLDLAETEVEFGRQLSFMRGLEKRSHAFGRFMTDEGSGGRDVAIDPVSYAMQQNVKGLRKKYGKKGEKMKKRKQRKENLELISESAKDIGISFSDNDNKV